MASEKKVVEIEMNDGSKIALNKLTTADLPNVKLTIKDGESNLTMKSTIIKEGKDFDEQRRLFKWSTMKEIAMYTVKVPKSLEAFRTIKTDAEILEYAVGNYVIESDKENNGMTGGDPEKKANDTIKKMQALGLPEKLVNETITAMKKAGFLK
jgi:hypothetical protein